MMRNSILFAGLYLFLTVLASCDNQPRFKVEGTVSGADGKTLYLEQTGIESIETLDSVELNAKGSFSFRGNRPASPEFYRLRIEDKIINFAIDSTEVIGVDARYEDFPTHYQISGSENNEKIKELTLLQIGLQNRVQKLVQASEKGRVSGELFEDSLSTLLNAYKDTVKMNYIFVAPNTSYAYFALFQRLGDYLIFDPLNNKEDIKCFGAVATSLNNRYPHADRSKNLYNIAIKGMKNTRTNRQKTVELPEGSVAESGIIDISLKDLKGNQKKLSDLKGKVVLLDFIIYQSPMSSPHNIALHELYEKYAPQGLEIYQVSLDADEHFWKSTADRLPWICVRDAEGIYSPVTKTYNIGKLPSYFLIDRNNELNKRDENIKSLEEEIKKLL